MITIQFDRQVFEKAKRFLVASNGENVSLVITNEEESKGAVASFLFKGSEDASDKALLGESLLHFALKDAVVFSSEDAVSYRMKTRHLLLGMESALLEGDSILLHVKKQQLFISSKEGCAMVFVPISKETEVISSIFSQEEDTLCCVSDKTSVAMEEIRRVLKFRGAVHVEIAKEAMSFLSTNAFGSSLLVSKAILSSEINESVYAAISKEVATLMGALFENPRIFLYPSGAIYLEEGAISMVSRVALGKEGTYFETLNSFLSEYTFFDGEYPRFTIEKKQFSYLMSYLVDLSGSEKKMELSLTPSEGSLSSGDCFYRVLRVKETAFLPADFQQEDLLLGSELVKSTLAVLKNEETSLKIVPNGVLFSQENLEILVMKLQELV